MVRSIGGSFCQLCRRFGSNSLDDDFVGLLGSSVITIVIQIDVDVIGIFANDATGEFAVGELQCITGVVLQWDFGRSGLLFIQIGVWSVSHQLVAIAVHIEVTLRYLGIAAVEIADLTSLRTPA